MGSMYPNNRELEAAIAEAKGNVMGELRQGMQTLSKLYIERPTARQKAHDLIKQLPKDQQAHWVGELLVSTLDGATAVFSERVVEMALTMLHHQADMPKFDDRQYEAIGNELMEILITTIHSWHERISKSKGERITGRIRRQKMEGEE